MGTLAAGIKEIFATAKTTGSNVMLCGNDGTPDGHMTMANLASVLGANIVLWDGNLNDIWDNKGAFRTYRVGAQCSNKPVNQDGYMYCFSWGAEGYYTQVYVTPNTNDMYIRSRYNDNTWSSWKQFSTASYLNQYENLSSLANALGVSALNSSSLFRIISGTVPQNQAVDVDCGNGLLFVGVFSSCTLYWPFYWSTVVQRIAGEEDTQYTVTKSAQSRVVHITAPSSFAVSYAYIGFTA